MEEDKESYLNEGELLYFAENFKFKTSAVSWLVTMTTVAERLAPKARSLKKMVMIPLVLAMKIIVFNDSK